MNHTLQILYSNKTNLLRGILVLLGILIFLFALDLMAVSFEHLGSKTIEAIISAASNPFIGLFIGLLITAIIQSSSTTTTMIVAAVATGSITLHNAIPIIMGANIGTTITSTMVAVGYIAKKEEFKKAISAAALHNFFNISIVFLLFPLEYKFGIITSSSDYLASKIMSPQLTPSIIAVQFKLFDFSFITDLFSYWTPNPTVNLLISFLLLFGSIKLISKVLFKSMMGNKEKNFKEFVFKDTSKSFFWGALSTGIIQSSSITTSLVVPLVARDKITLKKVIPFILGANIGTTITAFIAVLYKSHTAVNIAIVHFLINFIGVLLFLFSPLFRHLLEWAATRFGDFISRYRFTIMVYILMIFFIIPFLLIFLNQN